MLLVYLALGGAAGTVARYGLGVWIHSWAGTAFPWGTLAVNALGSLALGFVLRAAEVSAGSPELRGMLAVGFCGAFTTFSTFGYETLRLVQDGQIGRAGSYVAASVALGLAGVWGGVALGALAFRVEG